MNFEGQEWGVPGMGLGPGEGRFGQGEKPPALSTSWHPRTKVACTLGGGAPGSLYGPVGGMRGRSSHSPKLPTRDADITSITLRGAQTGTPQAPGFLLVMDQVLGSERGLEGGHLQERSARPGLGWVAGPEAAAGWPSWSDKKMRLALVIP